MVARLRCLGVTGVSFTVSERWEKQTELCRTKQENELRSSCSERSRQGGIATQ